MTEIEIGNKVVRAFPMVIRNGNLAWVGGKVVVENGQTIVINPKRITFNLYPGSGDYIGWNSIDIANRRIAVFTSIEVKTINDYLTEDQRSWFKAVIDGGGIAEIWKETKDGIRRITDYETVCGL